MTTGNYVLIYTFIGFAFAWYTCFLHKEGDLLSVNVKNSGADISGIVKVLVYSAVLSLLTLIWPLLLFATIVDFTSAVYTKCKVFFCKQ